MGSENKLLERMQKIVSSLDMEYEYSLSQIHQNSRLNYKTVRKYVEVIEYLINLPEKLIIKRTPEKISLIKAFRNKQDD